MADVDVTNVDVSALETLTELTTDAATADVADTAQAFNITPTAKKQMGRCAIVIKEAGGTAGMTFSLAAGAYYWASGKALTGTVTASKTFVMVVETAKYKNSDGKMVLTLTPASGKKLKTDHAAEVGFIELY